MTDDTHLRPWKKLAGAIVLDTPWFKIYKDKLVTPQGVQADYYYQDGNDAVVCVCITADGTFILEEQYRPPIGRVSLDYPAGHIDPSDANPEAAARREIEEETGYRVGSIKRLATLDKDPGFTRNKVHIFLARDLRHDGVEHRDPTEDLKLKTITADEVKALVASGRLSCAFCVAATYLAFQELGIIDS